MSAVEYIPWSRIEDIDVPVGGHADITHIRVPYSYGRDATAVVRTAHVAAWLCMKSIMTAQAIQRVSATLAEAAVRPFEGPLVRFRCSGCENDWDAWVNDTGHLEDPSDSICTTPGCPRIGRPADVID